VLLVVLDGKEYGSGSSRDWAAKGTALLGVRAVLAESFERIHRSNLIGMGVLPVQFPDSRSVESLGLNGEEVFTFEGFDEAVAEDAGGPRTVKVRAERDGSDPVEFEALVRLDTPNEVAYYNNGGILHRVLRDLR
jgi:aconitate hydratase